MFTQHLEFTLEMNGASGLQSMNRKDASDWIILSDMAQEAAWWSGIELKIQRSRVQVSL